MFTLNFFLFGITSTYVEKTKPTAITFSLPWDHLHIRGENYKSTPVTFVGQGSPPHTWRKLDEGRIE